LKILRFGECNNMCVKVEGEGSIVSDYVHMYVVQVHKIC